jgi:hypothetical protein
MSDLVTRAHGEDTDSQSGISSLTDTNDTGRRIRAWL